MSDDLICTNCGEYAGSHVADRIEELEAKLAKAVEALELIAHASDFYSVEANAEDHGADTLAYAHKSTCNLARATLANLKGQDDE